MSYFLAEASHNTFVLFDFLSAPFLCKQEVLGALICEGRDDAIILTDAEFVDDALYAHMRVLGLDGLFGEFCANGACSAAAYLFKKYPHILRFYLKTGCGVHALQKHEGERYSVRLPRASFELNPRFVLHAHFLSGLRYIDMIEPHLAINEQLSDEALFSLGRRLNQRKDVFPLGINVNAWHVLSDGMLFVKTYERGVQRLTKSCGTGSLSCASLYQSVGKVAVTTPGGLLDVTLDGDGVQLIGSAIVV